MTASTFTVPQAPDAAAVLPDHLPDDFLTGFPSAALVEAAASRFRQFKSLGSGAGRGWLRQVDDGIRFQISVAPGMIALGTRAWRDRDLDPTAMVERVGVELRPDATDYLDRARAERVRQLAQTEGWRAEYLEMERVLVVGEENPATEQPLRGRVMGWSPKSRARMTRRLAELNYDPIKDTGRTMAMLTLTLPGPWVECAPTGKAFKRLIDALRKRFERQYGEHLAGVWKLEFQRRGAPHLHIECAPPTNAPRAWHGACDPGCERIHSFREWLGFEWADVCRPRGGYQTIPYDPALLLDAHRRAGTGVDYREGSRASDPKRLAIYFAKHGSFSAKDYQHVMPREWADDGCGRFWGYWRLDVGTRSVEVRPDVAIAAARTLRRWSRQQHRAAKGHKCTCKGGKSTDDYGEEPQFVYRRRFVTDEDGVLVSRRRSKYRVTRLGNSRGFLLVNDGPALASQLARYLETV